MLSSDVTLIDFDIHSKVNKNSQGSYGVVVSAIRKSDGKEYAMKFFGYTKNRPDISGILREIDNLKNVGGIEGVAQLAAVYNDTFDGVISHILPKVYKHRYPVIVMEKLNGGELFDRILTMIQNKDTFSERDASTVFKSFIEALTEMHDQRNMIHIDLKTENLVFADIDIKNVKMIDFGMAVSLQNRIEHYEDRILGTSLFLAPETIVNHELYGQTVYSRATDIWQAGCILYTILSAQYPFGRTYCIQRIKECSFVTPIMYLPVSAEAKDLLFRMFAIDPNQRIRGKDILLHPWIVNHNTLPVNTFGSEYFERVQHFITRRKIQKMLDKSNLMHKQNELQITLSGKHNASLLGYSIDQKTNETTGEIQDVFVHNPIFASPEQLQGPRKVLLDRKFYITKEGIEVLKQTFIQYVQSDVQVSITGINYEGFQSVVLASNFANLASREIFEILDWNRDGLVDILEFLLTLSTFRNDVNWNDPPQVAKLYYEIFDMTNSGAISIDLLVLILNKLERDMLLHDDEEYYDTKQNSEAGSRASPTRGGGGGGSPIHMSSTPDRSAQMALSAPSFYIPPNDNKSHVSTVSNNSHSTGTATTIDLRNLPSIPPQKTTPVFPSMHEIPLDTLMPHHHHPGASSHLPPHTQQQSQQQQQSVSSNTDNNMNIVTFENFNDSTLTLPESLEYIYSILSNESIMQSGESANYLPPTKRIRKSKKMIAEEMRSLVESMDADHDGTVSLKEFEMFFTLLCNYRVHNEALGILEHQEHNQQHSIPI